MNTSIRRVTFCFLKERIEVLAAREATLLDQHRVDHAPHGQRLVGEAVDVLLEYQLDALPPRVEARTETVPAPERMFELDFDARDERIPPLVVHPAEVLAQRFEEPVARMLHVMLVIGVVDHALQVAFIIAHLVFPCVQILLHIS